MYIRISKYDAIKAILIAEEKNKDKLVYNMTNAIRRAMRKEIENNEYLEYYIIHEREKKYFLKTLINLNTEFIEDWKGQKNN